MEILVKKTGKSHKAPYQMNMELVEPYSWNISSKIHEEALGNQGFKIYEKSDALQAFKIIHRSK